MRSKGIQLEEEQEAILELEHINVKLLLENPAQLDLDAVVNVFHSWIQDQVCDELLLDVADYRHTHHGPGIVLIGHEADYAIDYTDGRLGLRYNRKAPFEGSNANRFRQAVVSALAAASRLQQDARLNGMCHFNGAEIEIVINDRASAPNTPETRAAVDSELRQFLDSLWGEFRYRLDYEADPRRLFGVRVKASDSLTISDLLSKLTSFERSHGIA